MMLTEHSMLVYFSVTMFDELGYGKHIFAQTSDPDEMKVSYGR